MVPAGHIGFQLTHPNPNAWSGIRVARNKNLVSSADTHPDFIYQTPLVRFNDRMMPLLEYDENLSINFHPGLKESLSELFQPRYGFKLDPENSDWSTRDGSFVDRICRAIEIWERNHPSCRKSGFYIFELQLYSSLEETLTRPLLQLKSLHYDVASLLQSQEVNQNP